MSKKPLVLRSGKNGEIRTVEELSLGAFCEDGIVSPAALGANTNNWNVTGTAGVSIIRVSASTSLNITGFLAQSSGREITLINISVNNVTIVNNSASSTAANRVLCGNGVNHTMNPDEVVTMWYDITSSRWRLKSVNI